MGWVGLSACMVLVEGVLEKDENLFKDFCTVCIVNWEGRAGSGCWLLSPSPSLAGLRRVGGLLPSCWCVPLLAALHGRDSYAILKIFPHFPWSDLEHFCLHLKPLEYV